MLLTLVERSLEEIRALDVERDAAAFAEQVLARNPGPFREIPRPITLALAGDGEGGEPVDRLGALLLARAQLRLIKELPDEVAELVALTESAEVTPHVRCAVLGALAYLVQPAELVDDRAPGGYGYVDDCIVLKTMRLALARMGVPLELDRARELRALSLLALALAPDDVGRMQNLVTRTWNEIHLLHMQPAHLAEARAHQIEASPLGMRPDWSRPSSSFTRGTPSLRPGGFGGVDQEEGITIDFVGGGVVHMSPSGDIRRVD